MKRMRLVILGTASLAAVLAAYLAAGLLSRPAPEPAPVAQQSETTDVLVAAQNITRGQKMGPGTLKWRAWPNDGIAPEMITRDERPNAATEMEEIRAGDAIVAGEPIVDAKLVRGAAAGFMSALLPEGRRAVSIQITSNAAASGFILPGDRVDVIFTRVLNNNLGNPRALSDVVITNVKVLAINQALAAGGDSAAIADVRTAVLELDPLQATVLSRISFAGQISLALRSIADQGQGEPVLAEAFKNPNRTVGPLVVRYGFERSFRGQ